MRTNRWAATLAVILTSTACGGGDGVGGSNAFISLTSFQPAGQVIGQPDFVSNMANQGGSTGANTLRGATGLGEGSLLVIDGDNNRVIGFSLPILGDNASADMVVGQPDFLTSASGTTATSLELPGDALVAGGRLFVADTANNRVLIWNTVPTGNDPANVVLGQADFTSPGASTTRTGMRAPISVAVAGDRLFVSDNGNNRILFWNTIPTTSNAPADGVLGQGDFTSSTPGAGPSGLAGPFGLWTDGQRLVAVDQNNNRVLIWNSLPTMDSQPADVVVGQPDFSTVSEGTGPQKLDNPLDVTSNGTQLFIGDCGNNRVLGFNTFPTADNPMPDVVLGQSNFNNNAPNDDDQDGVGDPAPTARTLDCAYSVAVIDGRLYVNDISNHRVLVFP